MNENRKTVLVVEDNDQSRMLFSELLKAKGYKVFEAGTGMAGWRIAQECNPRVILMDIGLLDISGIEVIKKLKKDEALKPVPILAVTIHSTEKDRKDFLEAGCDGYISKPISVPEFLDTVERYAA